MEGKIEGGIKGGIEDMGRQGLGQQKIHLVFLRLQKEGGGGRGGDGERIRCVISFQSHFLPFNATWGEKYQEIRVQQ